MNTRQMEIFVNIVRYGNFSNAAKKMYLSQPAVSANIDLLEKELETKLLIRQGRKTVLTEKGQVFYEFAQNILGMTEKTVSELKEDGTLKGTIRCISSFVPGLYLLPNYIKGFHEIHKELHFEAVIKNSKEALDGILNSVFDIGFVGSVTKNENIIQKHIFSDSMVLVAPNTAPYNELPKVLKASDIVNMPFVLRSSGSSTLSIFNKELKKAGFELDDLNITAEFDSGEAIIKAIKLGMGVSILSKICIEDDSDLLTFEIESMEMKRDFYAVLHNTEYLPPKVTRFFEYLPDLDLDNM